MARKLSLPRGDHTILMVDDQEEALASVHGLLEREGYRVFTAARSGAALDLFVRQRVGVLVIDHALLEGGGAELLRRVRALDSSIPVIMQCGALDARQRRCVMRDLELHGIWSRGGDADRLLELVESAVASIRRVEAVRGSQELRGLILAKFCHELRTSLHVIRGYTEVLQGALNMSSVAEILERLGAASDTALGLAQDYLDLARLDERDVVVRREPVDVDVLLEELRVLSGRRIGTRPVQFTTETPLSGAFIATDGEKLRAILAQLLANAIKFTLSGEIRLSVRPTPGRTEFVLADTGPGINERELPSVLTPAGRLRDESATAPGQGVGLAIALRLSALIGASLTASAREHAGALFVVSLPAPLRQRAEAFEPTLH